MDEKELEGSIGIGFLLGFFLSLIGVLIAYALDKKRTIKGAWIGFLVSIGGGLIFVIFYICILVFFLAL